MKVVNRLTEPGGIRRVDILPDSVIVELFGRNCQPLVYVLKGGSNGGTDGGSNASDSKGKIQQGERR